MFLIRNEPFEDEKVGWSRHMIFVIRNESLEDEEVGWSLVSGHDIVAIRNK
jgi:hypothetical protein